MSPASQLRNWNVWEFQGRPILSLIRGSVVLEGGQLKAVLGHRKDVPHGRLP